MNLTIPQANINFTKIALQKINILRLIFAVNSYSMSMVRILVTKDCTTVETFPTELGFGSGNYSVMASEQESYIN